MKRIKSFFSLSPKEKLLFFEALVFQYVTWMLLLILPFRRIVKRYPNPETPGKTPDAALLEKIRTATAQANVMALWKNRCLVQSLAARRMLSRRGLTSILYFGMIKGPNENPIAHSWITVNAIEIVNKVHVDLEFPLENY